MINYNAASMGFIGGADGPTAIFVSGNTVVFVLLCLGAGIVVGLVAGLLWRYYKKKKANDGR